MNLGEAKTKAEKEGSDQTTKFRATIRNSVLVVLTLVTLVVVTVWATRLINYNNSQVAEDDSTTTSSVVATGPRCDNKTRTIRVKAYQPGRPGCSADWNISDESPSDCVFILDANQRPIRSVCKGQEMQVADIPMTGWSPVKGEVLIDVTYQE